MAGPQLEHGHTRIAHEILEQVMKTNLNGTQLRIVMAVWRYTYGFQRKSHSMSISFLAKATNASTSQVEKNLGRLIDRNMICVVGKGLRGVNILGFNKNYKEWDNLPPIEGKLPLPSKQGEVPPSNRGGVLPSNQGDKKDIYKDNNKDIPEDVSQKEKYDENNTYYKMAKYFHSLVSDVANQAGVSHLIKRSNMQTWANDMRLLVEKDKVDKYLAKQVMDWVTQDSFWKTNVLSAKKLREKFTELAIKMNAEQNRTVQNKQSDPRDKEIAFHKWVSEGNEPDEFNWN